MRATQLLEYSATSELSETEYKELEKRLDSAGARDPENLEWGEDLAIPRPFGVDSVDVPDFCC